MATLVIDGVHQDIPATYAMISETEKQQFRQVIEDLFRLLRRPRPVSDTEELRRKAIAFARHHRTFPLDWSHNKLTREELNER